MLRIPPDKAITDIIIIVVVVVVIVIIIIVTEEHFKALALILQLNIYHIFWVIICRLYVNLLKYIVKVGNISTLE